MSEELEGRMTLKAAASRAQRGHFCWAGWNALQHLRTRPQKAQVWSPKTGAQFVVLTAVGSRDMRTWMSGAEPGHMGWTLKEFFTARRTSLGICWLKPPVGGFVSRPSQCTSAPKGQQLAPGRYVLECQWRAPWAQGAPGQSRRRRAPRDLSIRHRERLFSRSPGRGVVPTPREVVN